MSSYSPEILAICSTMPLSSFRQEKAAHIKTLELTSCSWAQPEDTARLQRVLSSEITSLVPRAFLPPPSPPWTPSPAFHPAPAGECEQQLFSLVKSCLCKAEILGLQLGLAVANSKCLIQKKNKKQKTRKQKTNQPKTKKQVTELQGQSQGTLSNPWPWLL